MNAKAAANLFRLYGERLAAAVFLAGVTALLWAWGGSYLGAEAAASNASAPIPAHPERIVSINPCADALLMQLADESQIVSISHYSHDKRSTSIPLAQALQFPATSGTAEEIMAMRPDLVIAGSHVAIPTEQALKRMGIPVLKLIIPQSVAESREQISGLANIIGQSERGVQLNKDIAAAFARAKPADNEMIPALIWRSGGLVPGNGTLPGELLRWTGFENVSQSYGLQQWDVLPLEHLVARPPRLLFVNGAEDKSPEQNSSQANRTLSHPVLKKLSHRINVAHYPERLLHCAGPTLIDAVTLLSAARRKLKESP